MSVNKNLSIEDYKAAFDLTGTYRGAAKLLNLNESTVRRALKDKARVDAAVEKINSVGYSVDPVDPDKRTPDDAWEDGKIAFERKISKTLSKRWPVVAHKTGPYVVFHATDLHLDDDAAALKLIEADIKASHDMGAIMVHGGDALNNWPAAGRLAKQWAEQSCTKADALLRLQKYISIFKPHVWVDGNHEEFNLYLSDLIDNWLPAGVARGEWTQNFQVTAEGGRTLRAVVSHKFQKGSSWFHKAHGHIREMLEGEEADLLMDGHLHSDGVLDHTLPERGHAALCVASSGYKLIDKYAARISHGGTMPKLRGRAHWIVVDPFADDDANFCTAFKCPIQAQAMLNGLINLRAA